MAKVKFPLEMAECVYVRTLEELKQNFDVKKVMSYFLDGRLKTWLEDRYYDDEAEKIGILNSNDEDLAQKLCEVFEQDFSPENDINVGQIQIENERVEKLKQYTDDEEIIKNVNSVAFNQDELIEKIKEKTNPIYLCEGSFVIPKLDYSIQYYLIGNAKADDLNQQEEKYSVILVEPGESKLKVMNALSKIPIFGVTLGLSDCKVIVDNAPQTIKDDVTLEEAKDIEEQLKLAGAKVVYTNKKYSNCKDILIEMNIEGKGKYGDGLIERIDKPLRDAINYSRDAINILRGVRVSTTYRNIGDEQSEEKFKKKLADDRGLSKQQVGMVEEFFYEGFEEICKTGDTDAINEYIDNLYCEGRITAEFAEILKEHRGK